MYAEDIIIEPILTEKSNDIKSLQKFVFKVNISANKIQIRQAIKKLYNVDIKSCRIVVVKGKEKRQGKFVGKTSAYKKAILTLKKRR